MIDDSGEFSNPSTESGFQTPVYVWRPPCLVINHFQLLGSPTWVTWLTWPCARLGTWRWTEVSGEERRPMLAMTRFPTAGGFSSTMRPTILTGFHRQHCRLSICEKKKIPITILILKRGPCLGFQAQWKNQLWQCFPGRNMMARWPSEWWRVTAISSGRMALTTQARWNNCKCSPKLQVDVMKQFDC